MSDPLLAKYLRENGHKLIEKAVDKVVVQGKTADATKGQQRISLPRKLVGAAMLRIASRSVPGALVVGGVLLAKHLHDKKKEREGSLVEGEATVKSAEPGKTQA